MQEGQFFFQEGILQGRIGFKLARTLSKKNCFIISKKILIRGKLRPAQHYSPLARGKKGQGMWLLSFG